MLVHHAASDPVLRILADSCCEECPVGDIVGGQGVAHEDDVVRLLDHDTHLALDFLQKGRRRGLEARLHDHRRVVRVGQSLAVDACASIDTCRRSIRDAPFPESSYQIGW